MAKFYEEIMDGHSWQLVNVDQKEGEAWIELVFSSRDTNKYLRIRLDPMDVDIVYKHLHASKEEE